MRSSNDDEGAARGGEGESNHERKTRGKMSIQEKHTTQTLRDRNRINKGGIYKVFFGSGFKEVRGMGGGRQDREEGMGGRWYYRESREGRRGYYPDGS